MMKLFKFLGPVGFLLVGVLSALVIAWLTGSRGYKLLLHAAIAVPMSFFALFLHDLMDNTMGLGNMQSLILVIACTTGVVAGAINTIWLHRGE